MLINSNMSTEELDKVELDTLGDEDEHENYEEIEDDCELMEEDK